MSEELEAARRDLQRAAVELRNCWAATAEAQRDEKEASDTYTAAAVRVLDLEDPERFVKSGWAAGSAPLPKER